MIEYRVSGLVTTDGWAARVRAARLAAETGKPAFIEARPPGFTFFYLMEIVP